MRPVPPKVSWWIFQYCSRRDRFYRPDAIPVTQPTVSKHWRINYCKQAAREAATVYPCPPCKLTFDLMTLKVVSESRVTWAAPVPILVFLGLSVLDLGPMYATDRQKTDAYHRLIFLMHPHNGVGGIISLPADIGWRCAWFFIFSYFFLFYFGSCGRLSRLNCQLSSARSNQIYLLAHKHTLQETINVKQNEN